MDAQAAEPDRTDEQQTAENPLGVEDPTLLEASTEADDAEVVRQWRTERQPAGNRPTGLRLTDPDEGVGIAGDDEKEAVAGPLSEDGPGLSAEEAAVHRREPGH